MTGCAEVGELIRLVLRSRCDSGVDVADADVFVDFENAQPTETELEVYELTGNVLEQALLALDDLQAYGSGATDAVRAAIASPLDSALQDGAWLLLLRLVKRQRHYYQLSLSLQQTVPLMLWELCSGPLPPVEQLEARQALTTQLARTLDFVLRFDELKMETPALQNDFSYYRRTMSRSALAYGVATPDDDVAVPCDLANTMSLFYAQPRPMLAAFCAAADAFVRLHPDLPIENTTDTFATMAAVCRSMADTPEFSKRFLREDETVAFCLRVLVGALIAYDHLHPAGVFARPSAVDVKAAVRTIRQRGGAQADRLLGALRFASKHWNDATTPKVFKALLE